jgi:hypothetical protein
MDEHQQSLLSNHISQAGDGSEKEPDDGALSFESAMYENPWLQGPMYQETNEGEQGSQGGELEIPAEEVIGEELQEAPDLIKTLEQEVEDEVHEIRWVAERWAQAERRRKMVDVLIMASWPSLHSLELSRKQGLLWVAWSSSGSWHRIGIQ